MIDSITSRVLKTENVNWRDFQFIQQKDFKAWHSGGEQKLQASILKYQFIDPFKVWLHDGMMYCLDGRHRYLDLMKIIEAGANVPDLLPATFIECDSLQEAAELVLVYSSAYARITETGLQEFVASYDLEWDSIKDTIDLPSFDPIDLESFMKDVDEVEIEQVNRSLQERFLVPPFSVLDSKQGYWQNRKKLWHRLGFDSQETREDVELIAKSGQAPAIYALRNKMREALGREPNWDEILDYAKAKGMHLFHGASIFDPVLCEVLYTWFCPPGATILDPFAGGSVRGVVAGILGFQYLGIDLRDDQVTANKAQWNELKFSCDKINVQWMKGDSMKIPQMIQEDIFFDFVFSCPPYHDLEKYSDDPADLSNMCYDEFREIYRAIIFHSLMKLKPDRFACFVVGDIRDEKGFYRDFVSETIQAFTKQPLCDGVQVHLYNEIILLNAIGSLAVRVGRQFTNSRKVGKAHQNVLVFYKGDPSKIGENFPAIDLSKLQVEGAAENADHYMEGVEAL